MGERYRTLSAIILMLVKENEFGEEVLLQKRQNTGYCDGFYDLSVSGHVEENETMKDAVCREAKEELGVDVNPDDLDFVCLIHKNSDGYIYYNGYFKTTKWTGVPCINEPEKNEEIKWFNIDNMPENLIDDRKMCIENYKKNVKYSEFGWIK